MIHRWIFLLVFLLSTSFLSAQNYSDEVTLESQDNNSITVLATASAPKKDDAAQLAVHSAFYTLFYSGIPEVRSGLPMLQKRRSDFDYRFFSGTRPYNNYIVGKYQVLNDVKQGGSHRVTVRVTIRTKSLFAYLQGEQLVTNPGWNDAKAANATAALNPSIIIIPDGYDDFETMRQMLRRRPVVAHVINQLTAKFAKHGYETRDFVTLLEAGKIKDVLRMDTQTDAETRMLQNLPGDIAVRVNVAIEQTPVGATVKSLCRLHIRAIEKLTCVDFASASFPGEEKDNRKGSKDGYLIPDSVQLANQTLNMIEDTFFENLDRKFEEIIMTGQLITIDMNLAETVTDWDFEQDSPETGEIFRDALDEWLREHAYQADYKMDRYMEKTIPGIEVRIPLWNMEKNRSYTISNFGSDLRKFLREQFGSTYKVKTVAMGKGLMITIE